MLLEELRNLYRFFLFTESSENNQRDISEDTAYELSSQGDKGEGSEIIDMEELGYHHTCVINIVMEEFPRKLTYKEIAKRSGLKVHQIKKICRELETLGLMRDEWEESIFADDRKVVFPTEQLLKYYQQ